MPQTATKMRYRQQAIIILSAHLRTNKNKETKRSTSSQLPIKLQARWIVNDENNPTDTKQTLLLK